MDTTTHAPLEVSGEEREVLAELLESERTKLFIEIRHTHHRSYRDALRARLETVEHLEERVKAA